MANKNRRMVGVPRDLAATLDKLAVEMWESYTAGRTELPTEIVDHSARAGRVPLHYVISRGTNELIDHKARSKRSGKRKDA